MKNSHSYRVNHIRKTKSNTSDNDGLSLRPNSTTGQSAEGASDDSTANKSSKATLIDSPNNSIDSNTKDNTSRQEGGSSFLSSVLSAAGNVLRAAGTKDQPNDTHKRTVSDGSIFGLLSGSYDDDDNEAPDLTASSDKDSLAPVDSEQYPVSRISDVKIEPLRPAIDTIGKGELSFESLGLTPIPVTLEGDKDSNEQNVAAYQQQQQFVNDTDASMSLKSPALKPSTSPTTAQDLRRKLDEVNAANDSHFEQMQVPELVIQQPERTSTPQFFSLNSENSNMSNLNLSNSNKPNASTSNIGEADPSLPVEQKRKSRSSFNIQRSSSANRNSDHFNARRSMSPAPGRGAASSLIAASSLALAGASVPFANEQFKLSKDNKAQTNLDAFNGNKRITRRSFNEKDRSTIFSSESTASFLKSPTGSLRTKKPRRSSGKKEDHRSSLSPGPPLSPQSIGSPRPMSLNVQRENSTSGNKSDEEGYVSGAGLLEEPKPRGAPANHGRIVGFAYANNKRNLEFHKQFRSLPPNDFLIDDFSCALSKEILLQGRMYVSEHHICFSSNIFGWVNTLIIGFDEVVGFEKKSTAVIFPNGIVIQTLHNRHSFASFISRDSVYELLMSIWKQASSRVDQNNTGALANKNIDSGSDSSSSSDYDSDDLSDENSEYDSEETDEGFSSDSLSLDSEEEFGETARLTTKQGKPDGRGAPRGHNSGANNDSEGSSGGNGDSSNQQNGNAGNSGSASGANGGSSGAAGGAAAGGDGGDGPNWPVPNLGPETHAPTESGFNYESEGEKLLIEDTINAPLGVVANLLFGNDVTWMTNFTTENQKNFDLAHLEAFDNLDVGGSRTYEYIKPINGSIGPKQTRCMCTDTIEKWDLNRSITVVTTTQTPDVPNGSIFVTKTKYTLSWTSNNCTKLLLTYKMDWSGRSLLKGVIEKGTHDGQVSFAKALVEELNSTVASARPKSSGGSAGKARKIKKSKRTAKKSRSDDKEKERIKKEEEEKAKAAAENAGSGIPFIGGFIDILMSPPSDYVPIPVWAIIVILTVFFWLFKAIFGGGSSQALSYENEIYGGIFGNSLPSDLDFLSDQVGTASKKNKLFLSRYKNSNYNNRIEERLARIRVQEEYLLWKWIEDRSKVIGQKNAERLARLDIDDFPDFNPKDAGEEEDANPKKRSFEGEDFGESDGVKVEKRAKGGKKNNKNSQMLKEAVKLTEMRLGKIKEKFDIESD